MEFDPLTEDSISGSAIRITRLILPRGLTAKIEGNDCRVSLPATAKVEPVGYVHPSVVEDLKVKGKGTWPWLAPISSHRSNFDGVTVALRERG